MTFQTGDQLKAEGQSRVLKGASEWTAAAAAALAAYVSSLRSLTPWHVPQTFTLEDFREAATARDLPEPPHVNAWGALTRIGLSQGLIRRTDMTRKAQRPQAHSRRLAVWEVV